MENKEEMLKIERSIGYILRIGVIVSATIILIGMILLFFQPATDQVPMNSLTLIMHELVQLNGEAFVMLGLFCLILTPVLRVVVSIFAFAKEKDYLYVFITIDPGSSGSLESAWQVSVP